MNSDVSPIQLVTEAVEALFRPGDVVELRVLGTRHARKTGGTLACGYFDDAADLAKSIVACSDGKRSDGYVVEACYVTMNPVLPALLARYEPNKMQKDAQLTTSDKEILKRTHLLIDCDPVRPAGISSSDEEKELTAVSAKQIKEYLTSRGWPMPLECDSGNGSHLIYRINLPNDDPSRDTIKNCLVSLASKFDTPEVKIDQSVFNSGRVTKAYGSMARKGAHTPQIGRPHRRSRMLTAPPEIQTVSFDLLASLAAEAPPPAQFFSTGNSDSVVSPEVFESQLDAVGVTHSGANPYEGGWLWHPDVCVFDPNHIRTSVITGIRANGAMYYKCSHNSCQGLGWKEFRAEVERTSGKKMRFRESANNKEVPDNLIRLWINSDPQALAAWNAECDVDAAIHYLCLFTRGRGVSLEQWLRLFQSSPLKAAHDAQIPDYIRIP